MSPAGSMDVVAFHLLLSMWHAEGRLSVLAGVDSGPTKQACIMIGLTWLVSASQLHMPS